jgi:hypothetical protein
MRLTEFRKAWIYKEIRNRVEQIGMPNQEIPRIIMTRKDWLALPKELTHGLRTTTHKNLGIIKPRSRIMFLNVRSHRNLRQLRETIVAELVRYWFPDLRHDSQFQQMKKSLLKGKIPFKDFKIEATLKIPIEQNKDELIQRDYSQLKTTFQ